MSRYHSYLNTASKILSLHKGEEPFSNFLKKFFSSEKKYGSTDRKTIAHLCYCYFRLGKALPAASTEDRILTGLFLCSHMPNKILEELRPEWNVAAALAVEEKHSIINNQFSIFKVFPWIEELSDDIDKHRFIISHFIQPDLFLRIRRGYEGKVIQKLISANIEFQSLDFNCIALPNATKIDELIELDKEAVIQDLNSQLIGGLYKSAIGNLKSKIHAWDCCAASGGKSLLLYDLYPDIDLTVSDIRESIIANLKKRFKKAGIKNYRAFVSDLTNDSRLKTNDFDLIIADLPCTGSGTWSRTPEQLYFFDEKKIGYYSDLQKKILSNIIPSLQTGGYLVYSTCSVFKKENEDQVEFLEKEFQLQVIKQELLKGYDKKADSLFVALMRKIG